MYKTAGRFLPSSAFFRDIASRAREGEGSRKREKSRRSRAHVQRLIEDSYALRAFHVESIPSYIIFTVYFIYTAPVRATSVTRAAGGTQVTVTIRCYVDTSGRDRFYLHNRGSRVKLIGSGLESRAKV